MNLMPLKQALIALPRPYKRLLMVASDMFVLELALWLAFALYFDDLLPRPALAFGWGFVVLPISSIVFFYLFGLYDSIIRFQGRHVVYAALKGVGVSVVLMMALFWFGPALLFSPAVIVLYGLLAFFLIGGSRFFTRSFLQPATGGASKGKPVIIYGAGASGMQAALSLINGPEYAPVAFVDDDHSLQGTLVQDIRVYPPSELNALIKRFGVNTVLLAMPSVSRRRRKAIVSELDALPVLVKTLPGLAELVSGAARVNDVREVQIEDLLGRDAVVPDKTLLSACVTGKVVMVTGAAGSIGSELVRQIIQVQPRKLVLYDRSEHGLYQIERLVRRLATGIEVVPILGSVTNLSLLEHTMRQMQVQTVYHAAAYKHVPLVEYNVLSGIRNNVLGTWRTAEAAIAAQVESFVLISTDKAVRPTNVMGATKRCAELIIQGLARRLQMQGSAGPIVSMVRFGNVLGSSGSVVPLFREQIAAFGPVTVTHPDIIRYFMTTPEAANLVIQAGAMAKGGEVFVLDMGEPVRILDLAKRMIRLAGYDLRDKKHPDGDIEIQFTGLRPGEKLYEELLIGADVSGTTHSKILRAKETYFEWDELLAQLRRLETACREFDCASAQSLLKQLVSEYKAADKIVDHLWSAGAGAAASNPVLLPASNLQ